MFAFKTGHAAEITFSMANLAEPNEQLNFVASPLGLRCLHVSHMSRDMGIPTMWHFDTCRLSRACAAFC